MTATASQTEKDLEVIRHNEAALELIQASGGRVVTQGHAMNEDRDWEAEAYLDVWVGKYTRNIAEHYHEIIRAKTIAPLKNALLGPLTNDGPMANPLSRDGAVAVVGAGPSLDANVEHLRGFPGLIIACDRAAKALTARGIKPDLVVCVDPRPAVMADMLNYPENRDQRLVLSVIADPEVPRVWRGQTFYMSTIHQGTQFFERILPEVFPGMPATFACGNVGNTGVQIAEWLGAKKIVLVGQDYGYPGNKTHCEDWVRLPQGNWMRAPRSPEYEQELFDKRTGKITVDGVTTYAHFLTYRDSLREMIATWGLDVVNATEGGILSFLPQATLADVVADLTKQNYSAAAAHARLEQAVGGGS